MTILLSVQKKYCLSWCQIIEWQCNFSDALEINFSTLKTSIDDPSVLLVDGSDFQYLWYFHQKFFCQICFITVYCCDVVSEYIIPLLVSYLASPKFPLAKLVFSLLCQPLYIFIPRFNEVDRGVYWYHLVRLSVRPSVRLWTESCPLCIFNNTHRIHFIFAHLIKQLKVCRV